MYYSESDFKYNERIKEWNEIEDYVLTYQLQFKENPSKENIN